MLDSLNAGSPKEIEQVTTGSAESPAIIATTALESTPPERKAPSGTSEIIRSFTDSRSRRTSSSPASCSVIERGGLERHVPVLDRLRCRLASLQGQGAAR